MRRPDGETLELEADHRRHAEIENAIRDLKYGVGLNHLPSGRFAAKLVEGCWLAVRCWPTTSLVGQRGSVWVSRWLPPRPSGGGSSLWRDGSPARRAALPCICHRAGLGKPSSAAPWPGCEPFHSRPDGQPATDPTSPPTRASPARGSPLLRILSPSYPSQLPQTAIGALCGD